RREGIGPGGGFRRHEKTSAQMRAFGSVCLSAMAENRFDRTPQQRGEVVAAYLSDVLVDPMPRSIGTIILNGSLYSIVGPASRFADRRDQHSIPCRGGRVKASSHCMTVEESGRYGNSPLVHLCRSSCHPRSISIRA